MAIPIELMHELKQLSELHRQGGLTPEQMARLQEIRAFLDAQNVGHPAARPVAAPQRPQTRPTAPGSTPRPPPPPPPNRAHASVQNAANPGGAASSAEPSRARPRPRTPDEAAQQLTAISRGNQYTPPTDSIPRQEYFAYGEGFEALDEIDVELPVVDPRMQDVMRATSAPGSDNGAEVMVMPGGVFLDDFAELYTTGLLTSDFNESPAEESRDPNLIIPGKRKVTVHMLSGEMKRGFIQRMGRGDANVLLLPQGAGRSENLAIGTIKAIFVSLNTGQNPPAQDGRQVTVTFPDRRSVQGASTDVGKGPLFTLIPPPGKGFEKIIINAQACLEVK